MLRMNFLHCIVTKTDRVNFCFIYYLPLESDGNVAIPDVFDPKKFVLDVIPADDILPINEVTMDFLSIHFPNDAKRLSYLHCLF